MAKLKCSGCPVADIAMQEKKSRAAKKEGHQKHAL